VLLMSEEKARELDLKPRARIVKQLVVGSDPVLMLTGPIVATQQVLKKSGMRLDQMDRIEVNEAFAPVVLAWEKELGADMRKVNVNGGAIALGHPLGATGARLMTSLVHELERSGLRYGLQTMCCGGGLGTATIVERLD
jgi:acetyl-CoA acyltransferase